MKGNLSGIALVVILFIIICIGDWYLFAVPSVPEAEVALESQAPDASTTVILVQPLRHATVGMTFEISGTAPSDWYFEAVFPIQVDDASDTAIGSAQAEAQSDWTVPGPVPFKASVTLAKSVSGPVTVILMRNNPSCLLADDKQMSVPITIK